MYGGEFSLSCLRNGIWQPVMPWKHNDTLHAAGFIEVMCLAKRNSNYALNTMYVEFENVADPGDEVSVPAIDLADQSYYSDLGLSATRDYLRLAVSEDPHLFVESGYELYLGEDQYNGAIFYATTTGSVGVHGKEFSSAANSKVCGLAMVAAPDFSDETQDVIYSRAYYDAEYQWLKEAADQLRASYRIKFVSP